MRSLALALLCYSLLPTAQAQNMNWDAIEAGAFEVTFQACTADSHPALVRLQLTSYSPVDLPPDGYKQANKEEVNAAAQKVFEKLYAPVVASSKDAEATSDAYLSDIATVLVTVKIETGEEVQDALVTMAMNMTKFELMKDMKYSGMGVGYELSHVFVNRGAKCSPLE